MDKEKHTYEDENMDWDEFFREEDEGWEEEKERRMKRKTRIVKIVGSLIAVSLIITGLQVWFNIFNIPALRFLDASQRLSSIPEVSQYKESVVTVEWNGTKGTGFNIREDGLIVTNEHVVDDNKYVNVYFKAHGSYIGTVLATDEDLDLAIVDIQGSNLPSLKISSEKNVENWLDEKIIFIGNPLAYTQIANEGTVIDTITFTGHTTPVLILDAPVYRGNSGSPVINQEGEVIGVVYATYSSDQYENNVGLATPAFYIWDLLE